MLEMWLSKVRLLLNSTPRFLTDDEEFTEQPSSVRQYSRLLLLRDVAIISKVGGDGMSSVIPVCFFQLTLKDVKGGFCIFGKF